MNESLDRNRDTPLYKQIMEYILKNIHNRTYQPGELIPTERELSAMFSVSRYTVRRAITDLVHQGYLYRVQGHGTFVYDRSPEEGEKRERIIGVITPTLEYEYYTRIILGVERYVWQEGYILAFSSSGGDYVREAENIQRMKENRVAGLVILPAEDQEESTAIADLKSENFPFVLVDRRLEDCETNCVMSDNIEGGYQAAEYLIRLGHERIAFVKEAYTRTSSIHDRLQGYKKALKDYGLEFNPEMVLSFSREDADRDRLAESLYDFLREKKPTAVIAIHDFLAINVIMKVCRDKGISIPEELSLIGFDNLETDRLLEIPLTTINQHPVKIGYNAGRILLENIRAREKGQDEEQLIHQVYCPVDLIVRDSCRPLEE